MMLAEAWDLGYDAGKNGANQKNCYGLELEEDELIAWSWGNVRGKRDLVGLSPAAGRTDAE